MHCLTDCVMVQGAVLALTIRISDITDTRLGYLLIN